MKNGNIQLDSFLPQLSAAFRKLRAYSVILFVLTIAGLYGYILWRINVYSGVQANSTASTQATTQPRVDAGTVQKILQLQNNSVNVQALFNEARQNPFQE